MQDLEKLKYPIGKFVLPDDYSNDQIEDWIDQINLLPSELSMLLSEIPDDEDPSWQKVYRPGSWTLLQLIHHLADSHMNSFIRFKQALTQDNPTIMAYDENAWVNTPDIEETPADLSLMILAGVHFRWTVLLENMEPSDWTRTFFHPEHQTKFELRQALAMYAWHGQHHLAHVKLALGV